MKRKLAVIFPVLLIVAGGAFMLYPTVSNLWNRRVQSHAVATYREQAERQSEQKNRIMLQDAEEYNRKLGEAGTSGFLHPEQIGGYEDLLDITGTGIMGYITIEKLNLELPIYHGTDSEVLQIAVGHLEGSSLPVGGEGTHSVISAHRGLPSARLFTDLDKMEEGDTFEITVLDRLLTYQVDQIEIIEPDEIELLQSEEGKDYCTLMTCTPYGVNSQRLLVRGVRIENEAHTSETDISDHYRIGPLAVIFAVLLSGLAVVAVYIRKKVRKKRGEA